MCRNPSNDNNNNNMTAFGAATAATTSTTAARHHHAHPMADAPIWSRLLFHWPISLLRLGMQRPLQTDDLWECLPVDSSARNLALFEQLWQQEQEYACRKQQHQQQHESNDNVKIIKPSLQRALVRDFFVSTWFVQPMMLIASAAKVVQAVALGNLIEYFEHASNAAAAVEDSSISSYSGSKDGYFWASVLVFCGLFVLFEHHHVFFWTWRKGMQIRIACVAAIYEKSLRLSSVDSTTSASFGKIMNLASNDVERFLMASLFVSYLIWAPIQAIAILVVGCISLQDAVAFGSGFALLIVFFAPLQFYLSKSFAKHRSTIAAITDKRVQFCSQAVRGARVMKMSGYEERFLQRIQEYRKQEMQQIQKAQNLKAWNESIFFASNVVISVVIFFVHVVLMGGFLNPGNVFTVFTLVNILQLEVTKHVSMGVMGCSECTVSIQRIQNFLEFPENQLEKEDNNKPLLTAFRTTISNANASEESTTTLHTTKLNNDDSTATDGDIVISMKNVTCYWDHVNSSSSLSLKDSEVTMGESFHTNDGAGAATNSAPPTSLTLTCLQEEQEKQQQQHEALPPPPFSLALKDISLDFRRGQLTSIIGAVGSGKSALLQAIIRELPVYSGSITTKNSINDEEEENEDAFPTIAYAAQDPWIMDGSVKQNIIMGGCRQRRRKRQQNRNSQDNEEDYAYEDAMDELSDEEWYQQVIETCSLLPDLEQFRHGDATIVGDRGVQCSGGQRARIGLARALYRNADVLVLDDPLSAVDAKVGRQLFQMAIMKLSVQRNKCVILATHQHQYINVGQEEIDKHCQCVLITAGRLECIGTYHECIAASNGKLTAHTADDGVDSSMRESEASTNTNVVEADEIVAVDSVDESDAVAEAKNNASLAAEEQKEMSKQGIVQVDTYIKYLQAMGGVYIGLFLAVLFSVTQASVLLTIASVGRWAEQPAENQKDWDNVGLVVGMAGVVVILAVGRAFFTLSLGLKASQRLHDRMAEAVLRAKIVFFDTNPLGRILNRFSADVGITDDLLPTTWFDFLVVAFIVLGSIVTTVTTLPFALAVIPPLSLYFWRVRSVFVTSTRELKRLEGLARSPIFAMLGESLGGMATIRANNFVGYFQSKFRRAHDAHTQAFFAFISASRWVGFRMDSLVYSFLVIVSYLSLLVQQKQWFDIDPAILGLSISFILYLAGLFQWCIRQSAEVVNQMVSVERIIGFGLLEPEAALTKSMDQDLIGRQEWPSEGAIEFDNVSVRYRPTLPLVLEGVSFKVPACSRVGIVGRTGSGKSTVVQTLFRLLEAENGRIVIDGVDIAKLGLHALRTKISVIPQVPTLFSGCSVRENLDLFGLHSDEALRQVLESCHLTDVINELPQGWDSLVSEGGSNFSVGQRQLLCLARAVLSQNKILVLDEATASVDRRTDQLLQEALRKTFQVGTIIAVAHRLETVIDCDCVLVLGQGRVLEFGSPAELMRRSPNSNIGTTTGEGSFASMVQDTGETTARELRQRAFQKEAETNATKTAPVCDSRTTNE